MKKTETAGITAEKLDELEINVKENVYSKKELDTTFCNFSKFYLLHILAITFC